MMRALYRWELGVRLAAVVLALLGLSWLMRRFPGARGVVVSAVLATLMVIESVANVPQTLRYQRADLVSVRAFEDGVTDPLSALIRPGERAMLYGPGGVSPGSNDYTANFICGTTGLRCYNAGGDKAMTNAAAGMSAVARDVVLRHRKLGDAGVQERLSQMFAAGELDVVVLVNFNLGQISDWPPLEELRATAAAAGGRMFTSPRYQKTDSRWFSIVRSNPG